MRYDILGSIIRYSIIVLILLTPIINLSEIQKNTNLTLPNINIRQIKEFGMIIIMFLSFIRTIVITHTLNKTYKYFIYLLGLLSIVLLCNINSNNLILLCGLRWFLPFMMFVFVYDIVDISLMTKIYKTMSLIFVIHILLQIYELFYMTPYLGTTIGGLAARVPGVMPLSHASALFICIFYLLLSKFETNNRIKIYFTILVLFSLLILMSSTGLIVFCVIFFLRLFNQYLNNNKTLYVILPFLLVILYVYADTILGRTEGSSEASIGTRIVLFFNSLQYGGLFPCYFGYFTNAAIMMVQQGILSQHDIFYADSMYVSIIGNLGILAFLIALCLIIRICYYAIKYNYNYLLCWTVLFSLCSISSVITEIFPANIVFVVVFAYSLKSLDMRMYHCLS